MPIDPDQPGGSHDPTRAQDPVDPTRAQDPIDPTRVQPGVDATRTGDAAYARPDPLRGPSADEPLRRDPGDDDDRNAWWLWALLAAVLIAIVLFALFQGGDDDDEVGTADQATTEPGAVETAPEDTTADTTAETAPEDTADDEGAVTDDTTATTAAPADDGEAAAPDGTDDPGTVTTADGTDLFTLVQGDAGDAERLAPYADQDVTGEGVYVLDVVEGEGFWVGADDQQRIFAHVSGDATAEVEVGQRISFDGFLKANPPEDSAEVHEIPEDQGAELHRQQGHHIELRSLTPA